MNESFSMSAWDTQYFPAAPQSKMFWSSSPNLSSQYANTGWTINADTGQSLTGDGYVRISKGYVRLVRDLGASGK
jgi:hypothetical protein